MLLGGRRFVDCRKTVSTILSASRDDGGHRGVRRCRRRVDPSFRGRTSRVRTSLRINPLMEGPAPVVSEAILCGPDCPSPRR